MHDSHSLLFRYLRECYELDTRTINLSNFFSRKVEDRLWVDGADEVLMGRLPYLPILDDYADKVAKNLEEYSKEKSLYGFAHFLVGSQNGSRVCAPLIFIPAEIVENDEYRYVQLKQNQKFLNVNFLNSYKKEGAPDFSEIFSFLFESDIIDFGVTAKIATALEMHFDDIESDGLRLFPDLISERKIKARRPKDFLEAHAGFGIGILRYSSKTIGIKSELDALSEATSWSTALTSVVANYVKEEKLPKGKSRVPAILSSEQSRVLDNALKYSKSVVVGPPGTGKSYTIANMAVDQVLRGNSVLIVSKTDEAVDVVLEKLTDLGLEKALMRAGKQQYLRDFKSRIKHLLTQSNRPYLKATLHELEDSGYYFERDLKNLEEEFIDGMKKELHWGERLFQDRDKNSIVAKLRAKYIQWRTKVKAPNWKTTENYYLHREKLLRYYKQLAVLSYDVQLDSFLLTHRNHLSGFLKAIQARTLSKQDSLFSELNFSQILQTFPIWLCKLSDLFEVLPMEKDLFDLLIIDEASQCDLASIMPALQRAKKVVVVGDPNQLRHFSFVSQSQQNALIQKNSLTDVDKALLAYRDSSILDVCFEQCTSNDQVVFLDEHFRGNGELLAFSNKRFYADRLKIMKSLPVHEYQSLFIEEVNGKRSETGINEREINAVIAKIKQLNEGVLTDNSVASIGVLSPFRKQMERIQERINEEIHLDIINEHRILVGTPYSFQGNERDIMILSWTIDDSSHHSALRYLNNPQVFNVAITRAKRKMINLISFSQHLLPADLMLKQYLSKESKTRISKELESKEIHDEFVREVSEWLSEIESAHQCEYNVASIPVDILITSQKKYKAIDLVGYPGKFYDSIDLNQYMLLQRAGVAVFPLPYTYWFFQKEFAKKEFIEFLFNE